MATGELSAWEKLQGGGSGVQGHLLHVMSSRPAWAKQDTVSIQPSKLTTNFSKIAKGKGEIRKPVEFPVPASRTA